MINLILIIILTGCSTVYWIKPNTTLEDFRKDEFECRYASIMVPSIASAPTVYPQTLNNPAFLMNSSQYLGNTLVDIAIKMQIREDCMFSRGWEKVDKPMKREDDPRNTRRIGQ